VAVNMPFSYKNMISVSFPTHHGVIDSHLK